MLDGASTPPIEAASLAVMPGRGTTLSLPGAPLMSRAQAGYLGGVATYLKYGRAHYRRLGKAGAKAGGGRPRLKTYDEMTATAAGRKRVAQRERDFDIRVVQMLQEERREKQTREAGDGRAQSMTARGGERMGD
ncbi:MAG: hypothetical protein ACR2HN_09085 [Tepidiformaceae bacterium]